MPLHFLLINYMGLHKLKFELLEEAVKLVGLGRVELWSSTASMGGHLGHYRLGHCGIWMGKMVR